MPVAEGRELLTVTEACERFNISKSQLRYWISVRIVGAFKRGDGRVLIDANELKRVIEQRNEIRPVDL